MKRIELSRKYLQDRFVNKKWTYYQIYKETGWSKAKISKTIGSFGLRRKRTLKNLNLIGETFGKLIVLGKAPSRGKANYWYCKCLCGNPKELNFPTGNLLSGNTSSCGCINHLKGAASPTWKGIGKLGARYWNIMIGNAQARGIYFDLKIEQAWELFQQQNEKCALTGWPIILATSTAQTASLDRIDSNKGYINGNVQWVHKDVNKAKNTFTQEYFLSLCKSIVQNKKTS